MDSNRKGQITPPLAITNGGRIGRNDKSYFEKLVRFASQKDEEAFSQAYMTGVLAEIATKFNDGEKVFLSVVTIFSGMV